MAKEEQVIGTDPSTGTGELFIDFDAIEDYEAVPQGMYPATIIDSKIDAIQSGNNAGKPKLVVTMALTAEPYVGRKVFRNYSLVAQSLWALKRLAKACDVAVGGKVNIAELPAMFVGSDVAVSITHRTYMGEVRANVQNVFPMSTLEGSSDEDIASMFS